MNKDKVGKKNINKQLMIMAAPLLLGDIFQQFYNTIDAVIVGRYIGKEAFAAIGIAGGIMNLFILLLGGCCTGISIILAQLKILSTGTIYCIVFWYGVFHYIGNIFDHNVASYLTHYSNTNKFNCFDSRVFKYYFCWTCGYFLV